VKNRRRKVTVVHKANVLKALTGVFRETALDVGKRYAGKLEVDERIVDACAMQLVLDPWQFDVIVTTNLFGDILSDEIDGVRTRDLGGKATTRDFTKAVIGRLSG
jgi:isocitrate dehydrogenase (NAD+)